STNLRRSTSRERASGARATFRPASATEMTSAMVRDSPSRSNSEGMGENYEGPGARGQGTGGTTNRANREPEQRAGAALESQQNGDRGQRTESVPCPPMTCNLEPVTCNLGSRPCDPRRHPRTLRDTMPRPHVELRIPRGTLIRPIEDHVPGAERRHAQS